MKNLKNFFISLIISFMFMMAASETSFLFPIHSRVDQNIFFTLGRGILQGKVPYRDLFEHKGPLIYFIHAAGALISKTSFVGVFVMQVLFFAVSILFMYKTAKLFTTEKRAWIAAMVTAAVSSATYAFKLGDNAEEFCWAFLMVSLYYLVKYFKDCETEFRPEKFSILFLNGIMAGCVLWLKFTQLGFWIGYMAVIFFYLIANKKYGRAFASCGVYLGGMAVTALPWIVYFGIKGALSDLFTTYFYDNIFLYGSGKSFFEKIISIGSSLAYDIIQNPLVMFMIGLGIFAFCVKKQYFTKPFGRACVTTAFLVLYIMLYIGGVRYDYYMLIATPFMLFGTIYVLDILASMKHPRKYMQTIAFALCFVYVIVGSNALPYYGKKKSDFPQFVFADTIKERGGKTLLNYGFIDGGFYLASGIEPINRFFCKVNIPQDAFPEMYDEQIEMVRDKKVDFAVIRTRKDRTIKKDMRLEYDDLFKNYTVIQISDNPYETYRYFLLEKNPD